MNAQSITNTESPPDILHTRSFKKEFTNCLARKPVRCSIVVPFLGQNPWGGIIQFAKMLLKDECAFCLVTLPPNEANNRLSADDADMLQRLGVDLRIRSGSTLHSKVYQFSFRGGDRVAFVGSANFSKGGLENNDETVALFRATRDNEKVAGAITSLYNGGAPYIHFLARKKV